MGSSSEALDELRAVPLFAGLPHKDLWSVAAIGNWLTVDEGQVLTRHGGQGPEGFLIVSGNAYCVMEGGEESTLGKGDFVASIALLPGAPPSATVIAAGPMKLFAFDKQQFLRLVDDSPTMTRTLLTQLAERLRGDVRTS
jgi:CRP/FNR family cyclic AMP-dependent transcriptional regulator